MGYSRPVLFLHDGRRESKLLGIFCRKSKNFEMKAGELVLASKPFAYVLLETHRGTRCDSCFKSDENLRRCTKCAFVYYCNKDCQKRDWKEHKTECANLVKLKLVASKVDKECVRLMARIIVKLGNPSNVSSEVTFGNLTRSFSDLISHEEDIRNDAERMKSFLEVCVLLRQFMGISCEFSDEELLDVFGKISVNSFGIIEDTCELGNGVYLGASAFDHSCFPNCACIFDGVNLDIRLLEDVSEPSLQNLFVNYTPLLQTRRERRATLKKSHYFECNCTRCRDESMAAFETSLACANEKCSEPVPVESESCQSCGTSSGARKRLATDVMSRSAENLPSLKQLTAQKNYDQVYALVEEELETQKMLHPLNIHKIRTIECAYEAAKRTGKLQRALELGSQALDGYRKYHPKYFRLIGFQLWDFAVIYSDLNDYERAFFYLNEADAVLQISYSKRHPRYQTLFSWASKLAKRAWAEDPSKISSCMQQ